MVPQIARTHFTRSLVTSDNHKRTLTHSNLELAALVLHKATLLEAVSESRMAAPRYRSDNYPTVSWSMRKALMINLVIADLLRTSMFNIKKT